MESDDKSAAEEAGRQRESSCDDAWSSARDKQLISKTFRRRPPATCGAALYLSARMH